MQKPIPKAYILVSNDRNEIQKNSAFAAQTLSSIVKTCIGPRAMQKMVLTKINSIEMTNDGNSILRELDVAHPSARCLIELSQTQDDECGDGTTSVLILAAELLSSVVPLLDKNHPIRLCSALNAAKNICIQYLNDIAIDVKEEQILSIVTSSVATKLCSILKVPIPELAFECVKKIMNVTEDKEKSVKIDLKTDIKICTILGSLDESEIIDGLLIEKEIVHSQMRRVIENPKILVLDTPIEYKKGESVTNLEFTKAQDFTTALKVEEDQIRQMCAKIIEIKPDVVFTEKGISDLALSIFYENGITAVRRIKASESIRLCKATGASILNRIENISEKYLGTAGRFEYIKIANTHYCKISKCSNPKAVTVVIKGPSKDLLVELERNFMDAVKVAKNVMICPSLVPGGGASEMGMSLALKNKHTNELEMAVFDKCINALRVLPSILASNSGASDSLEILNSLEIAQKKSPYFGINGITGEIQDMNEVVMEPLKVKSQCVKSAFESVMQLLRVDGIVECKTQ